MYCVAHSQGHNYYFIQWEIVFFIQHLFYHFSPLNHLFFQCLRPFNHIPRMEKQLLAINDLYALRLDQQREINNKLVHKGIRTLFQQVTGCCDCVDASQCRQM